MGNMTDPSPLSQSVSHHDPQFYEDFDAPTRGASIVDGPKGSLSRANSNKTSTTAVATPSRGGTLKKKSSVKRNSSLMRSGSRRSLRSSSIGGMGYDGGRRSIRGDPAELKSAFYTPVPTSGTPTAVLADRFEGKISLAMSP